METIKERKRKEEILKENFIYFKNATKEDIVMLGREGNVYFFDTENSPIFPKDIVEKYDLKNKEYDTLEAFQVPLVKERDSKGKEKDCFLHSLIKEKKLTTKIYVWQFGANNSNKVYWGNTIEEFLEFIHSIDREKVENSDKKVSISPYQIYVHNLAWDIEFFKYYFKEKEFKQLRESRDKEEIKANRDVENSFKITETQNTVHSATIQLEKTVIEKRKSSRKNSKIFKYEFLTTIEFKDSAKISPDSLKNISKSYIEVEDIYIKNSEVYKYNLVRDTNNYIPSYVEAWYIYCDIYLLKEWYNQFVTRMYINEGIKPYTISQIAFDLILKESFKKVDRSLYIYEGQDPQKVKDRQIYENHFALHYIEKVGHMKEIIDASYKGGHTTASRKFRELGEKNYKLSGVSMDITSSYPSQMCLKPLPFGKPRYYKGEPIENLIDEEDNKEFNYHFVTIAFDGFISKNPLNQFGLNIKLRGLTQHQKEFLNISSNESSTTNLVDYEFVGHNKLDLNNISNYRRELIEKHYKHNFIYTIPYSELLEWLEDYDFYTYKEDDIIPSNEIIFIDTLSFKSEVGFFKDGLMKFYNLKDEADKMGDKPLKLNAKLIINSFYGKNASNRAREQRFYNFNKDVITFEERSLDNLNEWEDKKLFAKSYASAVTSWGRIQLRKTVRILGGEYFVYADTDSIKMNYDKKELIKRVEAYNKNRKANEEELKITGININEKILGAWDFEYSFIDSKIVGQKKYMYKEEGKKDYTVKCAGLPKEIRDNIKIKEEFSIGKRFIKTSKKKVVGGNLLVKTSFSITDLIRN